jgi:uncharacterized protein (DUF433 family)
MILLMQPVQSDPQILGGKPCFAGTRVPVESLFDHLRRGYTTTEFLEQFPTVDPTQVEAVLDLAMRRVPQEALRAAG